MTPRQQSVLHFIEDYCDRHGVAPTYAEIAAGVGIVSKSAAFRAVFQLKAKGFVDVTPSGSRGITVLKGRRKGLADVVAAAVTRFGADAVMAEVARQTGRGE